MESLDIELYRLFVMVLAGIAAGFLFDLYRVFRWATDPRGLVVYIEDALFWAILTPLVIFALLVSNWIELRFYPFLGFGLGFVSYLLLASPAVVLGLTWTAECVRRACRALRRGLRRACSACRTHAGRVRRRIAALRRSAARVERRLWARVRAVGSSVRKALRRLIRPRNC